MADLFLLATRPRFVTRVLSSAAAIGRLAVVPLTWAMVCVAAGLLLGFAICFLPPTGAFGLVAIAGLALLWALPELPSIPFKLLRRSFFVMIVVDLCVPAYYTISVAGLPWISARRLVTFILIFLFAISMAGSRSARTLVNRALSSSPLIIICAFGFYCMGFLSIFTSIEPGASLSVLVEASVAWYLPLLTVLYVVRTDYDILVLVRTLCWCGIVATLAGALSFVFHKNVFIAIMPGWLIDALVTNTPAFARMLIEGDERHGLFRTASVFSVSLSFAEFEAMIIPVGYFFFMNGVGFRKKLFGTWVIISCLAGIFFSGSRGGYMSAIVGTAAFGAIWVVRAFRFGSRSLLPSISVIVAIAGVVVLVGLIATVPRLHNAVIGGGAESYSDLARLEQWQLGIPKIESNPVTGHGLGLGGEIVGYHATTRETIDSYVLSTLVETGVPGFIFFFGLVGAGVIKGVRMALMIATTEGALSGALAASLSAFGFYRIALSQIENHTTFFVIIGILTVLGQRSGNPIRASSTRAGKGSPAA